MKHLLLTFDYELFLGRRSGSVRRCLLDPTATLQALLEDQGLRGIFFVDALHLARLEDVAGEHADAAADLRAISSQLQGLARSGHEIFLHLHPHWLDARYRPATNDWDLSAIEKYRLEALPEPLRGEVFALGMAALRRALGRAAADLPFDGYRAGGWSIQPFSSFADAFGEHGIRHDFSVLPGAVALTEGSRFDFRQAPDKPVYHFAEEPSREDPAGPFVELAITRLPWSGPRALVEKQLLRVLWRTGRARAIGDGVGATMTAEPGAPADRHPDRQMASAELLTPLRVSSYLDHLERSDYLQLISHPKMQTPWGLTSFARFLRRARARFAPSSDFRRLTS